MKKLHTLFAVLLMTLSSIAFAESIPVNIHWPFAVSSPQANMVRGLIETANTQQTKYNFVFSHKPGAGGSIAARAVTPNQLSVLASTSSFYIRPLLYKDSHTINDYNMVAEMCTGQPLAIFSKKFKSVNDFGKSVTVGVIPGSITTLVTRSLSKSNSHLSIVEVPYKGTTEATTDLLGGHVDGSVDFIGKAVLARFDNTVNVVGITGNKRIGSYATFESMGAKGLTGVTNDYFLFVHQSVDEPTKKELHSIFRQATNNSTKVKEFCTDDFGTVANTPYEQLSSINTGNAAKWSRLASGMNMD
jgi:tripartite-type tricarboxylate transporter receptor subunit TctC